MQVYIYIFIILIARAAAGLQNGQSYFRNMRKIGHFPVFIGWGSLKNYQGFVQQYMYCLQVIKLLIRVLSMGFENFESMHVLIPGYMN